MGRAPRPVLVDTGIKKCFRSSGRVVPGTPGYIPPETWPAGVWYPRGDIYSLGVVFFQMLSEKFVEPCDGRSSRIPMEYFPRTSPEFADFVGQMTCALRQERPRAREALKHPWVVQSATSSWMPPSINAPLSSMNLSDTAAIDSASQPPWPAAVQLPAGVEANISS